MRSWTRLAPASTAAASTAGPGDGSALSCSQAPNPPSRTRTGLEAIRPGGSTRPARHTGPGCRRRRPPCRRRRSRRASPARPSGPGRRGASPRHSAPSRSAPAPVHLTSRPGYARRVGRRGTSVRSPPSVQDTDLRPSELLPEPVGRRQVFGTGQAGHHRVSYGRGRPPGPGTDRLAAVRAALPALCRRIYLNTVSAGPLPAETAAAMAEIEPVRARDRPGRPPMCRPRPSSAWTRPGPATPPCSSRTSTTVALTHCATDGVNIGTWSSMTGGPRRPGRHDPASTRAARAALRLRDRAGVELVLVDAGAMATRRRRRRLRCRHRPRHAAGPLSHVAWTTGAILPVAAIAGRPCPWRARRRRWRAGRGAIPFELR